VFLVALIGAMALSGCSSASPDGSSPHPADPAAPVPAAVYRSVTGGYESQRPADPQSWQQRNRRAAPQAKE
jgi:hypothetical protein